MHGDRVGWMTEQHAELGGIITPDVLSMLQHVFDDALDHAGYRRDSREANLLASSVLYLYLRGVRREEGLRAMLEASFAGSFSELS